MVGLDFADFAKSVADFLYEYTSSTPSSVRNRSHVSVYTQCKCGATFNICHGSRSDVTLTKNQQPIFKNR